MWTNSAVHCGSKPKLLIAGTICTPEQLVDYILAPIEMCAVY